MRLHFILPAFAALMLHGAAFAAETSPAPAEAASFKALPQEDVLAYIEELMHWQKDAAAIEATTATTREILLQDNLQQSTLKVLRSGFKFAKLEAKLAPADAAPVKTAEGEEAPAPQLTPAQRMRQRADENDKMVLQLQDQIEHTKSAAAREPLQNRLKLALAKQELYQSVLANISAASSSNGFAGQLAKLEQSVPELNEDAAKQASAKASAAATAASNAAATASTSVPAPRPVASVFTLAGDMFAILRKQRVLHNFAEDTQHLEETSRGLIKPLRVALDDISSQTGANINDQVATFNRIGSVLIPLGDATFGITNSKATVDDWQGLLDQRLQATFRQFLIKLAILGITIAIPLVIGEAVRRAIKKYIRDTKRQRQANVARRIVVSCVILFILLFNFISDFSSFATFAGFMTAGLAVALQSVLLSLVAHFFFYGRYGVRAGDRVNVAGVTGDILQIGIVRFYMRELTKGADGKMEYTGKTVAFPNSILFQPTAFYKYIGE